MPFPPPTGSKGRPRRLFLSIYTGCGLLSRHGKHGGDPRGLDAARGGVDEGGGESAAGEGNEEDAAAAASRRSASLRSLSSRASARGDDGLAGMCAGCPGVSGARRAARRQSGIPVIKCKEGCCGVPSLTRKSGQSSRAPKSTRAIHQLKP